jgi:hypothetical protein
MRDSADIYLLLILKVSPVASWLEGMETQSVDLCSVRSECLQQCLIAVGHGASP